MQARETAFPKRKKIRSLCSHVRRNGHKMFASAPTAWRRNGFAVGNAAGNRFFQRIARLRKRLGRIGA